MDKKQPLLPLHTDLASKLLLSSSAATHSDSESAPETPLPVGEDEVCPEAPWYYLFLRNAELRRYIRYFSGRTPVPLADAEGRPAERTLRYRLFAYTTAAHRARTERCAYTPENGEAHVRDAEAVRRAFRTGAIEALNALTDDQTLKGDGYLFVQAPLAELQHLLSKLTPRRHLVTAYGQFKPVAIPSFQMEEFIYLYEALPYNVELLARPFEDYARDRQRIRITAGLLKGKEGCIMRLHRNMKLVLGFGNMTVAVGCLKAYPFEVVG